MRRDAANRQLSGVSTQFCPTLTPKLLLRGICVCTRLTHHRSLAAPSEGRSALSILSNIKCARRLRRAAAARTRTTVSVPRPQSLRNPCIHRSLHAPPNSYIDTLTYAYLAAALCSPAAGDRGGGAALHLSMKPRGPHQSPLGRRQGSRLPLCGCRGAQRCCFCTRLVRQLACPPSTPRRLQASKSWHAVWCEAFVVDNACPLETQVQSCNIHPSTVFWGCIFRRCPTCLYKGGGEGALAGDRTCIVRQSG
jgi:hypothetical protein